MHCATCASTLEKEFSNTPGVKTALVNFGTGKTIVNYNPDVSNLAALIRVVDKTGFVVVAEPVTIRVGSMTCMMCAKTIEEELKNLEGVISVRINSGNDRVYVKFIPSFVSTREIKKAIEEAGFKYLGTREEGINSEEQTIKSDLSDKLKRIILGFVVYFLCHCDHAYSLSYARKIS